jgi:signal transduction histidine kinase
VTIVGQEKLALVDSKMIRHAITNLIHNAFKYSKKQDPKLALIFHNNTAVISVQDYGIGIPKNDQKQMFQPFYRAKNVVEFSGSGLGLAIAKNYVELNDGTINFESEENKGSRFAITFKLPE